MNRRRYGLLVLALVLAGSFAPAVVHAAGAPAFDGLPLDRALELADARSAAVLGALATIRQREAELQIARLLPLPHGTADYSLAPQAAVNTPGTIAQHSVTVGANISISDLLSADAGIHSAAATLLAAQRDADTALLRERERTVQLYFGALKAIATERLREDQLSGATRDRDAAAIRSREGQSPRLDVVRADVALAQARADLARATADRDDALAELAAETGVDPAALRTTSSYLTPSAHSRIDSVTPDAAAARAVAGRPEIASLRAQLRTHQAELQSARASVFPSLVAGAGYQRGVDSGQSVAGPQAAVHLELPFGNAGSQRARIVEAQIAATSAQLDETARTVALSAASATRDALAAQVALGAARVARDRALEALNAIEIGYHEGASSSLDVSDARRTYLQASLDALAAEYASAQASAIFDIEVP